MTGEGVIVQRSATSTNAQAKARLLELYDEVFEHDGYGQIQVDVRILRRGQKEVIVRCGKEYRFVIDFPAPAVSCGSKGRPERSEGGAGPA